MSIPKTILLTGAGGMVGKEIARQIFFQTEHKLIAFLHKGGQVKYTDYYLNFILPTLSSDDCVKYKARLLVIEGDITENDLGIGKEGQGILSQNVTDVIHCAGSTNFSLPIEESRKYNVEGTKNVLNFSKLFKHKIRFGYISTAFVAGKISGDISESESKNDLGFVNSYEQSKYEAESFLLNEQNDIPVGIYRLSTVLGNSKTGEVDKYIAPHQMMRLMYLGLISMIPGTPEYPVDLIAVDHAASTIVTLFCRHFSAKEIFHITAGTEYSYPLGDIIHDTFSLFEEHSPEWKKKEIAKPLLVSKEAFGLFLRSVEETGNPLMLQIVKNTKYFADQLLYPKNFQKDAVLKYISDYEQTLPSIREFYARVVKFCLTTSWKK